MRPPRFWFADPDRPGFWPRLLAPLGRLTAMATARRVGRPPLIVPRIPVICVGNLTVGGAGKTPAVIALAERLVAMGRRPAVISRGHGGRLEGPVRVDPGRHDAAEVGDEPLLISAFAQVFVARERHLAAQAAIEADDAFDVLVMDDGHQNPAIAKSLSIVVVDAESGFGNGRCLPAGPLREPISAGLARAEALLVVGPPPARESFLARWGDRLENAAASLTLLQGQLEPLPTGMDWSGARTVAFAGIGRPEKFFATLRELGADVLVEVALADHQPLSAALLSRLARQARALGAELVTTEKDAVRLPPEWRREVVTLPVRLSVGPEDALDRLLADLAAPQGQS